MRANSLLWACAVLMALSMAASLHAEEHMTHAAKTAPKFGPVPGIPACMTGAPKNGDPSKEAFMILAKATPGCKIPWHWHTGNEQLMFVSGKAKVEMKDGSATMSTGDYINLPAKHQHQFTCLASCEFFIESDRPFDIHYVDAAGKEIPLEEALKPAKRMAENSMKGMH